MGRLGMFDIVESVPFHWKIIILTAITVIDIIFHQYQYVFFLTTKLFYCKIVYSQIYVTKL